MKKFILASILISMSILPLTSMAQYYNWGNYQGQWMSVRGDRALTCGPVVVRFNPRIGRICVQNCTERRWEQVWGTRSGYRWICYGPYTYNCSWNYTQYTGPWFRYYWFNFVRQVRCF